MITTTLLILATLAASAAAHLAILWKRDREHQDELEGVQLGALRTGHSLGWNDCVKLMKAKAHGLRLADGGLSALGRARLRIAEEGEDAENRLKYCEGKLAHPAKAREPLSCCL